MSDATYPVLAGRYELHRQLASGGSAEVFLARDQLLNRPVAVKVLSAELAQDAEFVQRLRHEAQLVASLNHQNIVGVFDQGEEDGAPFIVMEFVEGRSLADVLRVEGRLHPDRAATIAVDVAAALDAAHRQGMVHMDVKPGNVLITADGHVKLADFGIAKALTEGTHTDFTAEGGHVMGTATYLSPEQARGDKVGPRSDVYSLAVVLYEMMTGRPPFIGDSSTDIARKHVEMAPQPPSRLGVDIAQSLEAITLKGLAKSPVNRYPSVRDFAADLKRYLGGAHSLRDRPAAATPATTPAPSPRPVTGRATPPEIEDATVVLPAASPAPSAPVPAEATVIASAAAPAAEPAAAPPATQQPIVVQRSDDTWKRNVLFFLALCILLVLLGFLVRAFLDALNTDDETVDEPDPTTETVTVADFTDRQADQAVNLIELAGLVPELEFEPNSDVEEGVVFDQDPPRGAIVEEGSTVVITVSEAEGRIPVPSVVTFQVDQAVRDLSVLGFNAQINEVDNDIFGEGEVISQIPLAGDLAERGSLVVLEVSLGPSERTVPDLEGVEVPDALNQLFSLGFTYAQIDEPDPEVPEGVILRTEPPAGSLLRGGELVTIVVSSGVNQVAVPSVVGLLADSARQTLVSNNFEVAIDFEPVTNPDDINKVLAQTPPANLELPEGTVVTIVVGQEPPPEETTTTTTSTTTTTTTTSTTTTTAAP